MSPVLTFINQRARNLLLVSSAIFSAPFWAAAQYQDVNLLQGITSVGGALEGLFLFGMSLVGVSALIMGVIGGVLYMMAGDSQSLAGKAKSMISNAVFGLLLALLSWLILFTINPDLIEALNLQNLQKIEPIQPWEL